MQVSHKEIMPGIYVDDEHGRLTYKVPRRWRRVVAGQFRKWRVCPRCGAIVPGHWHQILHIKDHDNTDELIRRALTRTLGEPGENGYDWSENTGRNGDGSEPDTGADNAIERPGRTGRGWVRIFR
jgi:hypothetical protein